MNNFLKRNMLVFIWLISFVIICIDIEIKDSKKIMSLEIGRGEGKLSYTEFVEDMERFGPESFAVSRKDKIYILDNIEKQVEIFDITGKYQGTINLSKEESYYDIEVNAKDNIVLLTYGGKVVEYSQDGEKINQEMVDLTKESDINFCILCKMEDGTVFIKNILNNTDVKIDEEINGKETEIVIRDVSKSDSKNQVFCFQNRDIIIKYKYEAGPTYPINIRNNEVIFIETEIIEGKKMYVEIRISKYVDGNRVETALAKPVIDYEIVPNKFLYVDENGVVYQMVCSENSVDIYELFFNSDEIN